MHHGMGNYSFPDGTIYEGEWQNHRMHGEGLFIDKDQKKWEGEFVNGNYQSKMQKQLKMEKMIKQKTQQIKEQSDAFYTQFLETLERSDKKTIKDNMSKFFCVGQEIGLYVKEPYALFDKDRKVEQWQEGISWIKNYTNINILKTADEAKIIEPSKILEQQFQGLGQIVEYTREFEGRTVKLVLCNNLDNNFVIVSYTDSAEPEKKK